MKLIPGFYVITEYDWSGLVWHKSCQCIERNIVTPGIIEINNYRDYTHNYTFVKFYFI